MTPENPASCAEDRSCQICRESCERGKWKKKVQQLEQGGLSTKTAHNRMAVRLQIHVGTLQTIITRTHATHFWLIEARSQILRVCFMHRITYNITVCALTVYNVRLRT